MTYSEALDWLEQVGRGGSRLGLDRVRDYLTRLGAPQDQIPMIHVAGTNGKGSVSTCLSAILTQAGYLEYTAEQDSTSRILFTIRRDELYRLREMGEDMDRLIQAVLRSYTGVFTDYTYINEDSLAIRTGLTRRQIYEMLVHLAKLRIVSYIPHKKTPYIIYTRSRVYII